MSGIFEQLLGMVGTGNELASISNAIGGDQSATQRGIAAALPLLLGGLANNAQSPQGASALFGALDKHDGSVLGDLAGLLGGAAGGGGGGGGLADGAKILGHIFGGRNDNVASAVSQKSGLDMATVMRLLPILAPIVMGFIGKMRNENSLDQNAVSQHLAQEKSTVAESEPALGGLLGMLDADGDGNVMEEIGGLLGGDTGGLGSILGQVLGGGK